MANLERDAGEPDNLYAFDPNEEDEGDTEASRLPLLIAIALVVLAAFAGVVWLAYTQGVEEGRADAPRIAAAAEPHRASPKTASTPSNPYAGLNIYQPPASTDAGNEPIAPIPSGHSRAAGNSPPALRPSTGSTAEKPAPAPQVAKTESAPPPASVAPKPEAAPLPVTTPLPATPSADVSAARVRAAAPGSGVMLQIGSYKSDAEARQSWSAFRSRHAIAGAFSADVKEVDLGAKGIWYRLRIGAFADKQAAAAFCEKLKAQGASCIVSR
ncbi:MAG TPA: SPOR domain-containing protein [Rhizomicrobium sp.]|jgi:cell division protein FtsN